MKFKWMFLTPLWHALGSNKPITLCLNHFNEEKKMDGSLYFMNQKTNKNERSIERRKNENESKLVFLSAESIMLEMCTERWFVPKVQKHSLSDFNLKSVKFASFTLSFSVERSE